jgi:hydroxymethylbilane synthase
LSPMKKRFVVGTRASKLALWQTRRILEMLRSAWGDVQFETRHFTTKGDKALDRPLPEIGGKGLFTEELENALRLGEIDAAVHSLKDLPVENAPGLTLGAIAERAPADDCLVARNGWTLQTLPEGAVVGTSSIRRRAQLLAVRPDLDLRSIRGNVETRVNKVAEGLFDAAVMARAGLERLGLADRITDRIGFDEVLPAPGQGALAVQCRAGDAEVMPMLAAIDDAGVRAAVTAERTFLEGLGGGCSAPVGAFATTDRSAPPWDLEMKGVVGSPDGSRMIRLSGRGNDPVALGDATAREALDRGAGEILAQVGPAAEQLLQPQERSLRGRRIVVTRSRGQSAAFCRKLEAAGAQPVEVPVVRIVPVADSKPLREVLSNLSGYDWAVFTSVNGVEHCWEVVADGGMASAIFEGVKVAAVGSATAAALVQRGVPVDFVPERFVGEDVARGLQDVAGKRICLLRAKLAGSELPELLRARGAVVDDVAVYENVAEEIEPDCVAELMRGVDAVTFTSGSTARNFAAAMGRHRGLAGMLANLPCACIGPVTAGVARDLKLRVAVVADVHTTDGLLDALVAYFDKENQR